MTLGSTRPEPATRADSAALSRREIMTGQKAAIGMIGLGVMGRNLLLNMADHDFAVAG
jgi:hypothetical protein